MSRFAIRLLTLAMFSMALVAAPVITTVYAAPDSEAPPPSSSKSKKKKTSEAKPAIQDAAFAKGYRAAYATIYERNDYASAIGQLQALGGEWVRFDTDTLNPIKLKRNVRILKDLIAGERVDVVHAYSAPAAWSAQAATGGTGAWLVTTYAGTPTAGAGFTVHGAQPMDG